MTPEHFVPLIVDTDGGVDDVLALLLLVASGRSPDLVTVCFGNVDLATAGYNTRAALQLADVTPEVHLGAQRPLVGDPLHAHHIHGEDGLGGAHIHPPRHAAASDDAVHALRRAIGDAAQTGTAVDLLTLGPLTNVALALLLEPTIKAGIRRLVMMGGTCCGRGNTTPAAEYNIVADPEAAAVVVSAGIPTTMVSWEACLAVAIPGAIVDDMVAAVPVTPVTAFIAGLARHARAVRLRLGSDDAFVLPDPVAAAVLMDRSIVARSVTASVAVELQGALTRGMTVVDPSQRLGSQPLEVVEEVNLEASFGLLARILACNMEAQRPNEVGVTVSSTLSPRSGD